MGIYINNELVEHSYEKTLIAAKNGIFDKTIIWIEGTHAPELIRPRRGFGIAGGPYETNSGIAFSKEELLEIANAMKEGATLRIAGCNNLEIEKVKIEFEKSNNMEKCGRNQFRPKK